MEFWMAALAYFCGSLLTSLIGSAVKRAKQQEIRERKSIPDFDR